MVLCITGGGTGGHLSVAKAFGICAKQNGISTVYIGSTTGQDIKWFGDCDTFDHTYFIETKPVVNQRNFRKLHALYKNISACTKSTEIFKRHKIDACLSVGGFSAAGGSLASIVVGSPLFIHEQNAIIGALNKYLKPFCKGFFSSFPFPKGTIVPYPVRDSFFETSRVRDKIKVIMFLGGSQGAKAINNYALESIELLKKRSLKVIHQCGPLEFDRVRDAYISKGASIAYDIKQFDEGDVLLFSFSENMWDVMSLADFCISRAGASTLWELAANKLPTLFVPYPYAAKNHQFLNAKQLADAGVAQVCRQDELCAETISSVMNSNVKFMSEGLSKSISKQGHKMIMEKILELTRK